MKHNGTVYFLIFMMYAFCMFAISLMAFSYGIVVGTVVLIFGLATAIPIGKQMSKHGL